MENKYQKLNLPVLTDSDVALLAELSNACAVSGNEREVRKIVRREVSEKTNEVGVGSCCGTRCVHGN